MTRTEFFEALNNGAKWNVGVSIARTNPLPLDANSVFQSVADLETYIRTNPLAYPGQLVSVIGETDLSAYHVTSVGENATYVKLAASTASGDLASDVATLQSQVSTLINDLDALEAIVGADAASGLRKDVADNAAAIKAVEGRLDTLEGADTVEGSVAKQIKDAIAEYKTTDDAALKAVDDKVVALTEKVGTVPADKTVVEMISDAQAAATYDDTALVGRVTAIEGDYLKSADKTELEGKITTNTNAITALTDGVDPEKIDGVKDLVNWVDAHGAEVTQIKADIQANADAIAAETTRATGVEAGFETRIAAVEGYDHAADIQTAKDYADQQIAALGIADYAKTSDVTTAIATAKGEAIADAEGKIATAKSEAIADAKTETENQIAAIRGETEETIASVATSVSGLADRISSIEAVGAQANVIESIKVNGTAQTVTDKAVDITVPTALNQLTGYDALTTEIAKKVDAVDGKSLVDDDLVTKLNGLANIKSVSTEFTISAEGQLGVSAIDASKITGLEAFIQEIHNPVATDALAGLVMANPVENGIDVAADGKMSVHSVNVNKIVQTDGDELILNGGNAGSSLSK